MSKVKKVNQKGKKKLKKLSKEEQEAADKKQKEKDDFEKMLKKGVVFKYPKSPAEYVQMIKDEYKELYKKSKDVEDAKLLERQEENIKMSNRDYFEIYHEENKVAKKIEMEQERDKEAAEKKKEKAEKAEKAKLEGKEEEVEEKEEKEEKEEEVKEITVKDIAQKLLDEWNKMKAESKDGKVGKVEFLGDRLKLPQKNNLFKRSANFVYSFGFKVTLALSIITSIIGYVDMQRSGFTIFSVACFQKINDEGTTRADVMHEYFMIVVWMFGICQINGLLWRSYHYLMYTQFELRVANLKYIVYKRLLNKDVSFFGTYDTGKLNTFKDSYDVFRNLFGWKLRDILHIGSILLYVIVQAVMTGSVMLNIALWGPLFVSYQFVTVKKLIRDVRRNQAKKYEEKYNQLKDECINNIQFVKTFSIEEKRKKQLMHASFNKIVIEKQFKNLEFFLDAIDNYVCGVLGEIAFILIVGGLVLNKQIEQGVFIQFYQWRYIHQLLAWITIRWFPQILDQLEEINKTDYFWKVFDIKPKLVNHHEGDKKARIEDIKGEIEFKNVFFQYPTPPYGTALKNFNVKIKAGSNVGFAGGSGCGKSTVINLIMRLYDPSNEEGEVLVDGINLKDLDLTWYHQKAIAIVSQNPQMFEGQVDFNIGYGLDECENTPEARKERLRVVRESSKLAAADGFIMNVSKFPDHYQTLVGEKGVKLSGGQKQRLAIARAMIKNPKILIFDEATSALDMITEKKIQDKIDSIISDKSKSLTVIQIAHRLSTIKNCDTIYMLKDNHVCESGTFEELMELKGEFYKMCKDQLDKDEKEKKKKEKLKQKKVLTQEQSIKKIGVLHKKISKSKKHGKLARQLSKFLKDTDGHLEKLYDHLSEQQQPEKHGMKGLAFLRKLGMFKAKTQMNGNTGKISKWSVFKDIKKANPKKFEQMVYVMEEREKKENMKKQKEKEAEQVKLDLAKNKNSLHNGQQGPNANGGGMQLVGHHFALD